MLTAALLLTLAPLPVRAEPVEAGAESDTPATRPSTSSGRTEAGAQTPINAERAFAADAQAIGQWTAFRKWSTDDAVMFVPQPVSAHEFLKDRKKPPKAIDWWPTASYISCDGTLAINVGGWKRPDGSVGSFTTVWTKQRVGGWRWLMDKGNDRKTALTQPAKPKIVRASCDGTAVIDIGGFIDVTLYRSADQTLICRLGKGGEFVLSKSLDRTDLSLRTRS